MATNSTTPSTAAVTLRIENSYELYADSTTTVTTTVPLPVPPVDTDERTDWEWNHIHRHTGVGNINGKSWYDVEVIDSSDPALLGMTFEFGY
ncbi:hypothetical protein Acsp01_55010 [Actinoplanes sp. NBRC 101535]|nr:hypothetical protein Acsp01_55010 [Actinoplanes sp. NBRC 101535]